MQLNASIRPPQEVLESLLAVVGSVTVEAPAPALPSRRFFGLFGPRDPVGADAAVAAGSEATMVPLEQLRIPITRFGNLTTGDARALGETIALAAAAWPPVSVYFTGGDTVQVSEYLSVGALLEGQAASLVTTAQELIRSVEQAGLFADRRLFKPRLELARVRPAATSAYVQALVEALGRYRGPAWQADISLTTETFVDGRSTLVEVERIALTG